MARFHTLRVAAADRLADDAVALTLEVPPALREEYRFTPGQHIALRRPAGTPDNSRADNGHADSRHAASGRTGDGQPSGEPRRTYSICSPAPAPGGEGPGTLRVGVRYVPDGAFSTYALKELAVGDDLEVMTPAGRFTLDPAPGRYAAVVGGSGITPVLSIAATLLDREPTARFCLLRSDRTAASAMFVEEVADLKDRFPDRFQLVTVVSREEQQTGPASGRLDRERLVTLLPALLPVARVDGWFLCGPFGLVQGAERALRDLGVRRKRIHEEIFHVDSGQLQTGQAQTADGRPAAAGDGPGAEATRATVTARLDGRSGTWPVHDGEALLDAVLRARPDAPYACRGGVCGTCRARLVAGRVRMDRNFALEPEETTAGYVLACQAHPVTEQVELDFDA